MGNIYGHLTWMVQITRALAIVDGAISLGILIEGSILTIHFRTMDMDLCPFFFPFYLITNECVIRWYWHAKNCKMF